MAGFSANGAADGVLYEPETDRVFIEVIDQKLSEEIPLVKVNANINDPVFADTAVDFLLRLMEEDKDE